MKTMHLEHQILTELLKSCAEFITESYKYSFFKDRKINIITARAGNVIGGGDYSKNRIVP